MARRGWPLLTLLDIRPVKLATGHGHGYNVTISGVWSRMELCLYLEKPVCNEEFVFQSGAR